MSNDDKIGNHFQFALKEISDNMNQRTKKYNTKQKDELLDYLTTIPGKHFTAVDVCDHFKLIGSPIGQSTVYRRLESMVDEGLVNKYIIDGSSPACFEYIGSDKDHDSDICFHCKCEKCGKLIHLHCDELMEMKNHLLKHHNFTLNSMRTVFYGLCEKCASLALLFVCAFLTLSLSACGSEGGTGEQQSAASGTEKHEIVTTIFPEYDWTVNILGDNPADIETIMLLDNGVDLHNYQPTADDILKISTCDIFIYVGGESDKWVEDALKEAVNSDMIVINLLDVLGEKVKEEEIVEGMMEEEEEGEEEEEEAEYDEHVWLSLKNASEICEIISEAICEVDPDNKALYKINCENYQQKLSNLDAKYQAAVDEASLDTLLFGDRFPFRYMTDEYGLNYYAAFAGCSAETEASFETVTFLSEKVDELSLHSVLTIEGTNHKIAETIVQNTKSGDQDILVMNSMQSVTSDDVESGVSFLDIMENNLQVLKEALR